MTELAKCSGEWERERINTGGSREEGDEAREMTVEGEGRGGGEITVQKKVRKEKRDGKYKWQEESG